MMPADGLDQLAKSDSVLLARSAGRGAGSRVAVGLLIRSAAASTNTRTCGLASCCRACARRWRTAPSGHRFYVVRENTEGEYSSVGGACSRDGTGVRVAAERVFACWRRPDPEVRVRTGDDPSEEARDLGDQVERIIHTMPYWDERFAEMGKAYPEIRTDQYHIDILCAHFVQHPDWFDVVVGSNLFGDILSDLGPRWRIDRHRRVGQHQSGEEISFNVRTGAWLGA